MQPIDFWFFIGSTYSYLTVMRLQQVSDETGIPFRWRPFNVRDIMVEQNNRPFVGKPVKTAYMWRDIERRARMYGLPAAVPVPYPLEESELANRVAVLGTREGWCPEYTRASYARWFQQGQPAGSSPNLEDSLAEIGQDPERVVALAQSEDIGRALDDVTAEATDLGIFGSPTLVVDGELFWGDDRLTDAVSWHRERRASPEVG
jgi:2-hydroxychromene-2-carboxylate isomerase